MSGHVRDLTKEGKFGRLTAVRRVNSPGGQKGVYFLFKCDCGGEIVTSGNRAAFGRTRSCGCLAREVRVSNGKKYGHLHAKHGLCSGRTYASWAAMLHRCRNSKCRCYNRYGGQGITVCERWSSFENFLADMGERPKGKTLDRFPSNGGNYEPGNCRWATNVEQARNKRNNVLVTYEGITLTLPGWANRLGVSASSFRSRYYRGWDAKKMITTPFASCSEEAEIAMARKEGSHAEA